MSQVFKRIHEPGKRDIAPIQRCQELLPNRMQCQKASNWLLVDEEANTSVYYCEGHAVLKQQLIQQAELTMKNTEIEKIQTEKKAITDNDNPNNPSTSTSS